MLFVEDMGLHLPRGALEVKNPNMLKNVGTLEHYRTINKILITFLDKTQCNQQVTRDL